MARVNILKQVKVDDRWRLRSIPRDSQGRYNWKALPAGQYLIEWYENGKRKRKAAGVTAAEALEAVRRKKHVLDGRALGFDAYPRVEEETVPLHVAAKRYLEVVESLKKPNTLRKYRAVLKRFLDFCAEKDKPSVSSINADELDQFMVFLRRRHRLGNNTLIHNLVIVAQFLKKQGRGGLTKHVELPEKIVTLPQEYTDQELDSFFGACSKAQRALYSTFLLTGFRDKEVVHLSWEDINFRLNTVKVTAKPDLAFYPKTWEEREVPVPKKFTSLLRAHPRVKDCQLVFPSPRGNREFHMLDKCKAVAQRAGLVPERFHLRKFRSTYATRMLQAGFDVRTVQRWMGHKSLETTMRYLAPAKDVHERLDQINIAGVLAQS